MSAGGARFGPGPGGHVRSLFELADVNPREWTDQELLSHLGAPGARTEARKRNLISS